MTQRKIIEIEARKNLRIAELLRDCSLLRIPREKVAESPKNGQFIPLARLTRRILLFSNAYSNNKTRVNQTATSTPPSHGTGNGVLASARHGQAHWHPRKDPAPRLPGRGTRVTGQRRATILEGMGPCHAGLVACGGKPKCGKGPSVAIRTFGIRGRHRRMSFISALWMNVHEQESLFQKRSCISCLRREKSDDESAFTSSRNGARQVLIERSSRGCCMLVIKKKSVLKNTSEKSWLFDSIWYKEELASPNIAVSLCLHRFGCSSVPYYCFHLSRFRKCSFRMKQKREIKATELPELAETVPVFDLHLSWKKNSPDFE
ncbi:hypothetical protein HNY73_005484 [Argiope bruennichi]|uniref:Uncharacterized protein n=1 Tax=Argiope bruennichi TaxID=94029 RepID=A0A8T0FHL5_ARGBR|nr:hypothetical protein HNY73_005484 [Argiope bruennichi]